MNARRFLAHGTIVLLLVLSAGPVAVAATAPQATDVFEREVLQAKLSPEGEPGRSRLYSQLTVAGDGEYTVVDPASTDGLRNLQGFGRPDTQDGAAVWNLDVDGQESLRTVSDYDGDLPLAITAEYTLDGEAIEPADLVGRSGTLTATYTVRNVSASPTEIEYRDAYGTRTTETVDLPVPLAGQFESTLPRAFSDVVADGGVAVGDGRGNTKLKWTLILFEPLGAEEHILTYTAEVDDATLPSALVQVVPVTIEQTPLSTGEEAYSDAADSTYELTQGATTIDRNLLRLATGAGQLLDGLVQLADGAAQLHDGLGDAASGSGELADGLVKADDGGTELATGLGQLSDGSSQLSAGMSKARAGGDDLAFGLGQLGDGSQQLADGLGTAEAGGRELADGLGRLEDGSGQLADGLGTANAGGSALADGAGQVAAGSDSAAAGADLILDGIKQIEGGLKLMESELPGAAAGADALLQGVQQLRAGLGSAAEPLTILGGLTQLAGGLPAARDGVKATHDGLAAGLPAITGGLDSFVAGLATQDALLDAAAASAGCAGDPVCVGNIGGAKTANANISAGLGTMKTNVSTQLGTAIGGLDLIHDGVAGSGGTGGLVGAAGGAAALKGGVELIIAGIDRNDPNDPGLILGLTLLRDGLSDAVVGVTQLSAGATKLRKGQRDLANGLDKLAAGSNALWDGASQLSDGLTQLDAGGQQLADGAGEAADGGAALAGGLGQLDDGAGQLADGAGRAAAGSGELADGLGQLDDGGKELAAGAGKAAAGSGELSDGLHLLRDGGGRLADGLGSAEDGSGQIADGLTMAKIGGGQVADGSKRLTEEGTSVLAASVNEANAEQTRNVALVRAMDERSRTDGMPAGAPEGATSSAVYSFELAAADGTSQQNALRLGLAGVMLAAMVGLGLLRRRVLGL